MSSSEKITFTKDNLDLYLKELAKEYRRRGGRQLPAELILIGGASVLINYGFREMTTDIDAVIQSASTMKEAINYVGDEFHLPNGWLNEDFKKTASCSDQLALHSKPYKSFYSVLSVRTIAAEYLIAMKFMSGRQYKNDLSDVLGILAEHQKRGEAIDLEQIKQAVKDLYGNWDALPDSSVTFIQEAIKNGQYEAMMAQVAAEEAEAKESLLEFEDQYPGRTTQSNVNDILEQLKERKQKARDEEER